MDTILMNQIWGMAVALVCGLLIALFYDIYWLLTTGRRQPHWLRALQDLLFWLAAFCLVAALWLYCTGGLMRLYIYLWLGLGIFLFRRLISPYLRRLHKPAKQAQPRKAYSIPPKLRYAATLPPAAMFQVGCFFCRLKPALFVKSTAKTFKRFFSSLLIKKEKNQ